MKRAILVFELLYLAILLILWAFIHFDQGQIWQVTLFLFSPRWVVGLPILVLFPLALWKHRKASWLMLPCLWIALFPIMGFCVGRSSQHLGTRLKIMTSNMGSGKIRIDEVVSLVQREKIQVVLFQECPPKMAKEIFDKLGWNYRQAGYLSIGSQFALAESYTIQFLPDELHLASAAVASSIQIPATGQSDTSVTVKVVSIHLPTFRPAFEKAQDFETDAGQSIQQLGETYRGIAKGISDHLAMNSEAIVAGGDFNVPVESAYFKDYWAPYKNAFSEVGFGLGYSKYTRVHGVRIDHVLANEKWSIGSAKIGPNVGGDHSPMIVELFLK